MFIDELILWNVIVVNSYIYCGENLEGSVLVFRTIELLREWWDIIHLYCGLKTIELFAKLDFANIKNPNCVNNPMYSWFTLLTNFTRWKPKWPLQSGRTTEILTRVKHFDST